MRDAPPDAHAALTPSEWDALGVAARISDRVADALILLSMAKDELQAEQGSSLLWAESDLDRAMTAADKILQRLSV